MDQLESTPPPHGLYVRPEERLGVPKHGSDKVDDHAFSQFMLDDWRGPEAEDN